MPALDEDTLKSLLPLLRQLREIKGLKEARPGEFQCRAQPFVRLIDDGNHRPVAELRKRGAGGFDRYALDTPAAQRKLVDDAKRRAAASEDD